jgi:tetratricopeptide (TPR) repeat protein
VSQHGDAGAEPLLREALARYRRAYGPDHPRVLGPMNSLYRLLTRRAADDPEAESLRMDILRVQVARLGGEIRALPNNAALLSERGSYYARLGRFREALADRERVVEVDPDDVDARFCAAIGALYLGDVDSYRRQAARMMELYRDRSEPDPLERAAKIYLLSPPAGADAGATAAAAVEMTERAMAANHPPDRIGWYELSNALALYRAGRLDACVKGLEKVKADVRNVSFGDRRYPEGTTLALSALAHHALGHAEAARQSLADAEELNKAMPQPGESDLGYGPDNWAVFQILLREARTTCGPAAPTQATPSVDAPRQVGGSPSSFERPDR